MSNAAYPTSINLPPYPLNAFELSNSYYFLPRGFKCAL
jgi:hypothetical protein